MRSKSIHALTVVALLVIVRSQHAAGYAPSADAGSREVLTLVDDWTDAMMDTSRMRGSTSASMTSRIQGEFSARKRPGFGEYGMPST